MTIAVCLKVMDGMVLAADSASTLGGGGSVENVYDHANKIVNLRKGLPLGVVFWGAGAIGSSSMGTLAKDFRGKAWEPSGIDWVPGTSVGLDSTNYTIEEVARRVMDFLAGEPGDKVPLGFFVAGYSRPAGEAQCWEVTLDENLNWVGPVQVQGSGEFGTQWRAQSEWITRLILGFSEQMPRVLIDDFGVDPNDVDAALQTIKNSTEVSLLHPAMPIQDAIDLATFLVELTKLTVRFAPGAPTVGGQTEVVAITKHEGFKWVARKHYFDRSLNPERDYS